MPEAVATPAPAQASLPLPSAPIAKPQGRFVIPDEPKEAILVTPSTPAAPAESEATPPAQTEGADATPPAPDGEQEKVTPEQAAKREGRRFERKLDKAFRQRAEAEARARILEQQIEQLKTQPQPAQQQRQDGAPTLEQHNYDPEAYAKAYAEFTKSQVVREYSQRQQQQSLQAQQHALSSAWEQQVEKASAKYDDFDEVVGELQPNHPITVAIMSAENGVDIAHYLGKNPSLAEKLTKLPPIAQIREIGKLEAKLALDAAKPKTPSKAPAPINPVAGNAAPATNTPSESDDMKTWMAKRNRQLGRGK